MTNDAPSAQAPESIDLAPVYERHPYVETILARLAQNGHEAVLVGGVVRDAVRAQLGPEIAFEPDEVDIATSAHPDEVEAVLADWPIRRVGRSFGVLIVTAPDGRSYEVATFRVESEYDGRWPGRVELVRDLARDLERRDFTVNGLAARPDGTIVDQVGGIPDLERNVVRAIGEPEERFREDHLRMLRAVRFACRLGASLEANTRAALRAQAGSITRIAWERIRDEFWEILGTSRSAQGMRMLEDLGLMEHLVPELRACRGVPQPEESHPEGDVYVHSLLALEKADAFVSDPLVKWAVLIHDLGKPEALERNAGENMAGHDAIGARIARSISARFRLSNDATERLVTWVAEHQRIGHFPDMGRGKQVKMLKAYETSEAALDAVRERFPQFAGLVQLMIADCQASAMRSDGWLPVLARWGRLLGHLAELDRQTEARKLVDGHDLIALGMPPGPELGDLLEELYERIYAGELTTREATLEAAERLVRQRRTGPPPPAA